MSNPTPIIHTSDRRAFKTCRQLWDFSSPLRMNLEPKPRGVNALWFGTGIHAALEGYYSALSNAADVAEQIWAHYCIEAEFDVPQDTVDLGNGMLKYYCREWASKNDNFTVVGMEVERKLKMIYFDYGFQLDGLALDSDGRYWILEFKTAGKWESSYDYLLMDDQAGSYLMGEQISRQVPIEGIIYTILKKAAPKPLKLLKSGHFSMDKQQTTTYDLARRQINERYGKIPDFYGEFLTFLQERPDSFVLRQTVRRNQTEIRSIQQSIFMEAKEMLNPNISIYRNPSSWNCNRCPFFVPCLAKWEGTPIDSILKLDYRPRKERYV